MADHRITTVSSLVARLGGARAVAEWLELTTETAVYNWVRLDAIPPAWHLRIYDRCRRERIAIDTLALFGVSVAA